MILRCRLCGLGVNSTPEGVRTLAKHLYFVEEVDLVDVSEEVESVLRSECAALVAEVQLVVADWAF